MITLHTNSVDYNTWWSYSFGQHKMSLPQHLFPSSQLHNVPIVGMQKLVTKHMITCSEN